MAKVKTSKNLSKNKKPVPKVKAAVSMAASAKKPAKKANGAKGKASSAKKAPPAKKVAKPAASSKKPLPKKSAPVAKKPAPKVVAKKPSPSKPIPKSKDTPKSAPKNVKSTVSTQKAETKAPVNSHSVSKAQADAASHGAKATQANSKLIGKVAPKTASKSEEASIAVKEVPKTHKPILIPEHLKKLQAQLEKIEDKPVSNASDEPQKIPQSELFSEQELAQFMTALENERDKLLGKTEATVNAGSIALNKDEMYDEVDLASATVDQNLTFRLLDRDRKLLGEIEHAIMKIRSGDYGYCEGTGEPIPKRRLELRPWCKYSVKYKEQLERMKKSGRGVVDEDEEIFA